MRDPYSTQYFQHCSGYSIKFSTYEEELLCFGKAFHNVENISKVPYTGRVKYVRNVCNCKPTVG